MRLISLVNKNVKILNKKLTNLSQHYIKRKYVMIRGVLSWECKAGSQLKINEFYHVNIHNEENNIIISIHAEKSLDKIQLPFLINSVRKLKIGTFLHLIKMIYSIPKAAIVLNGESLSSFPNKTWKEEGCLITLFNSILLS